MVTLALDPCITPCGAALYDPSTRAVLWSDPAAPVGVLCDLLWLPNPSAPWWGHDLLVLIERVRSQGQSGNSLLETSETVGRLQQSALAGGHEVRLIPRSMVLTSLGCRKRGAPGGKSMDSRVGAAVRALLGPKGTKGAPGPTYGVKRHAWQALGLACAYHEAGPALRARMDEESGR